MEKIELILEENQLSKIIDKLENLLNEDTSIVLLRGDLASGKTTLVKNYVKSLKIDDLVTSPTFSIQTIYGENIFHYDVYNKSLEEFISLGLLEEFEKEGTHFVEWGDDRLDELLNSYGFHTIKVDIEKLENKRRYIINA
ncbi:MAG: tRNA (adenosine(37)-N6)-threonylcarbamoyltransferase complex ATPase subunit type 1 TsaE [Arcobacter sp.]|uniref:tRNA (adenosine(37)-N6)-threonylcarbamoyltransferase complex ATPase subunit type 1 TsaE n=1 Tax=uncultured Arcobacter sp. TaxID=165434 RepID=UPI000CAB8A74|nr:tRNA (adenosine(37)-N6)-threonylcarbamoyltransferase complex ATPase subunit type 1 TsaE [uncultured Arcobacter sp.]PLY11442.1 MAG: tRNA (adenosine(37)-N6)-threonylcarbamoyltransferase complex ATPase subunit type 1 TsaE [Arcobacter sp.]